MITRRLPVTLPARPMPRAPRARRSWRWLALPVLLVLALFAGIALALSVQPALATLTSYLDALPRPAINPTNLLYHPRYTPPVDAILLLLAPAAIAALASLLSLFGPPYRRVILALLGLLVAAYNLLTTLAYIWEFTWNESGAGVINLGAYLALSASLALVALDIGLLHLALARAWTWPKLNGRHARAVSRLWVVLVSVGVIFAIVSEFMVWGHWRAPDQPMPGETVSPLEMLGGGAAASRAVGGAALLALPVCAAVCAWLWARAPRWGRPPLAALALLAGAAPLALGLLTLARLYLHARGFSVLSSGVVLGLGGAALLLIALFGLLSTPLPAPASIAAPVTKPVTKPIAAPVTKPVTKPIAAPVTKPVTKPIAAPVTKPIRARETKPVSAPVLLPAPAPEPARRRAPTTRRLKDTQPVS
jgi:hypothetical protein